MERRQQKRICWFPVPSHKPCVSGVTDAPFLPEAPLSALLKSLGGFGGVGAAGGGEAAPFGPLPPATGPQSGLGSGGHTSPPWAMVGNPKPITPPALAVAVRSQDLLDEDMRWLSAPVCEKQRAKTKMKKEAA